MEFWRIGIVFLRSTQFVQYVLFLDRCVLEDEEMTSKF